MSGTEASEFEDLLQGECVVRLSGPTEEPDLEGVEVSYTLRGTWLLSRKFEVHEFANRDELAQFLWAECATRIDSLRLLYGMGLLRVVTGPMLCRKDSVEYRLASAVLVSSPGTVAPI